MRLLAITSLAAAALVGSLASAGAQGYRGGSGYYDHSNNRGWDNRRVNSWNGWNSRNVSDPSFGNRNGLAAARRTGRCVVDLGYGRYEYCGW